MHSKAVKARINSNYLLIHSKAVKVKIQKTCEAKTENRLFYEPSLTHKGGSGGKRGRYLDSSHKVPQYLFIHSKAVKARIKEI